MIALVDTGSDLDAIDKDRSQVQSERDNSAFIARSHFANAPDTGFSMNMQASTDSESRWTVTFTGSEVLHGPVVRPSMEFRFTEFPSLGDPLIFGMPTVDHGWH